MDWKLWTGLEEYIQMSETPDFGLERNKTSETPDLDPERCDLLETAASECGAVQHLPDMKSKPGMRNVETPASGCRVETLPDVKLDLT